MKPFVIFLTILLAFSGCLFAQDSDPVLMTINNKPILKSEFEYIYNKNNTNNSLDKKTLDEYVDLFVNFKLKVEEAKSKGIDTTRAFISELAGYRSQLTRPYLTDQKVEEAVILEAYNHLKEDVDVSHILIQIPQNAAPSDTLKAWNSIQSILKRVQNEDFAKVAKEVSEDPTAAKNSGRLGFISAFRTVYPFELGAYSTPVGSVSKVVRSAFGYHIIKVHARRNSLGEVTVAHIMLSAPKGDAAKIKAAKLVADSLYKRVLTGDDFGALATKYSQDKSSSARAGELPAFTTGRMVPEFEAAAFALKNIGDISAPIQTDYGWHIIKLLNKKGVDSFESMKEDLERKVNRDERAGLGQQALLRKLRAVYGCNINSASVQEIIKLAGKVDLNDSLFKAEVAKLNKPLFSLANKNYSQADFAKYLKNNKDTQKNTASELIDQKLNTFIDAELLAYLDSQLEKEHPEFRYLMNEYHDGILLFEISNNQVWEKASKDTDGLKKYFDAHKSDYTWKEPHYKGYIISCKNNATFKMAKSLVRKSDKDSVDHYLRSRLNDSIQYVKVEKGIFVKGENKVIDKEVFKSKENLAPSNDYPFVFISGKMLKKTPENYTDVRGLVTADYQEYLEKEWIKALRTKYKVIVDQNILKTVKKN
jgi:peptidyl-prolyl cis-trans isomerase SurA